MRLCLCCLLLLSLPSFGQSETDVVEEIVVRASYRESTTLRTPASAAIISAEAIARHAQENFEELVRLVPNLTVSADGNRARYFQIRGIGELAQYEGAPNPSVGFIVDDIDLSGIGGATSLFGVEQVDVLRGPQGTRYGANALAGLIYVTTQDPADTLEGQAELMAGSDDTRGYRLLVGGPIFRDIAGSLAYSDYANDGFRDNPFLGRSDTNARDERTLRGKLLWDLGDTTRFRLTGLYLDSDNGYDAFAIDSGLTTFSDAPGSDAQRTLAAALRVEHLLAPTLTLTSITSAARSDITFGFDADWGNDDFWSPYTYAFTSATSRDRETLTQEIRLQSDAVAGLSWVAGVYGIELREANRIADAGVYLDPAFPLFPFFLDVTQRRAYEARNLALFGEISWPVASGWELAAGLRAERRNADYEDDQGNAFDPDETMLGGQVTLSRFFSNDITAYLRVARGYKAGGFNLGVSGSDPRALFDAEYLWAYETGIKWRSPQQAWEGELIGFWSERRDQQVQTTTQLDPNNPASFVFLTSNAGAGFNRGLEARALWRPATGWRLSANLAWLDTEVDEFGNNAAIRGRDQAHAPNFSAHIGVSYEGSSGWFAGLDVAAQGSAFIDYFEPGFGNSRFCLEQELPSRRLVGARAGWRGPSWSAEVWGQNLFDDDYALRGFCFGNEPPAFSERLYLKRGDPRHWGLTLRLYF